MSLGAAGDGAAGNGPRLLTWAGCSVRVMRRRLKKLLDIAEFAFTVVALWKLFD